MDPSRGPAANVAQSMQGIKRAARTEHEQEGARARQAGGQPRHPLRGELLLSCVAAVDPRGTGNSKARRATQEVGAGGRTTDEEGRSGVGTAERVEEEGARGLGLVWEAAGLPATSAAA